MTPITQKEINLVIEQELQNILQEKNLTATQSLIKNQPQEEKTRLKKIFKNSQLSLENINDLLIDYSPKELSLEELTTAFINQSSIFQDLSTTSSQNLLIIIINYLYNTKKTINTDQVVNILSTKNIFLPKTTLLKSNYHLKDLLINIITNKNYKITNQDLKSLTYSPNQLSQIKKDNPLLKLINTISITLNQVSKLNNYLYQNPNPNIYLNYLKMLQSPPNKTTKILGIISNNHQLISLANKITLTRKDIINFIITNTTIQNSTSDIKNLLTYYKEITYNQKIKSLLSKKVKEIFINYTNSQLNKGIYILTPDFINYYNKTYNDDFKYFGYSHQIPLNIRVLIESLGYDYIITSYLTGFESELQNIPKIKKIIERDQTLINEYLNKDVTNQKQYNYLLTKYQTQLKKLEENSPQTAEYYAYKNIDKQDQELFLELLNRYIFLNPKLKNIFQKKQLIQATVYLLKQEIKQEIAKNPQNKNHIIEHYQRLLVQDKMLIPLSNQINLEKLKK